MTFIRAFTAAATAAVIGLGTPNFAQAQDDVARFFKGKRIKLLIGSGPGGGYDIYARMVARHMGKYIPGNPSFLPQQMDGAGSIVAANFIANVAPKDGTAIGALQREIALVQIMGQKGPKYKAEELQWIGSLASEASVCAVATKTGINSFEDLFKREFVFGGTGPNVTEFLPALVNNLMGAKVKLIKGYPSTPPTHLAIQRGEVDGICQSWASFKDQAGKFMEAGGIKPLVQMTLKPEPEMQEMGVPMIFDFVKADNLASGQTVEDVKNFFRITLASGTMGRPYAYAAGVPAARVKAVREAFIAMTKDKDFLAEAKKQRRDVELVTGLEIQEIVASMAATPAAKLKELDEHLKFKGETAKAKVELVRHTGKVVETKRGGRQIVIDMKGEKTAANISGSGTQVSIDGKKAKRSAVKQGMTCTFVYFGPKTQAKELICKN